MTYKEIRDMIESMSRIHGYNFISDVVQEELFIIERDKIKISRNELDERIKKRIRHSKIKITEQEKRRVPIEDVKWL